MEEGVFTIMICVDGGFRDTEAAYGNQVSMGYIPKGHAFLDLLAELETRTLYTSEAFNDRIYDIYSEEEQEQEQDSEEEDSEEQEQEQEQDSEEEQEQEQDSEEEQDSDPKMDLLNLLTKSFGRISGFRSFAPGQSVKLVDDEEPVQIISMTCCEDERPNATFQRIATRSNAWARGWVSKLRDMRRVSEIEWITPASFA